MSKIILYGILLYLAYKFIFEFLIPVSKATSQVKDKLKEMQEQQASQQQYQQQQTRAADKQPTTKAPDGKADYIEFEEVEK